MRERNQMSVKLCCSGSRGVEGRTQQVRPPRCRTRLRTDVCAASLNRPRSVTPVRRGHTESGCTSVGLASCT